MALLPLAGWAEITVTTAPTLNAGATYTGADQSVIAADGTATGFGTYTFKYAVTTDGNAPAATATWYTKANLKVKNAGTYYVWYKVESSVAAEEPIPATPITGNFTIGKKALTVLFDGVSTEKTVTINYGQANPTMTGLGWAISYSGFQGSDDASVVSGTLAYAQTKTAANYQPDGTTAVTGTGYTMTFSGLSAANYTFTYPTAKMRIKQIVLAATPATIPADGKNYFTYQKNEGSLIYNAEAQTATYTIVYHDAQGNTHDLAISGATAKDYTLTYAYKATAEGDYGVAGAAHTNAGYYRPTITAEAAGNYSGSITITSATNNLDFQIAKRDMWVYVNDDTKVYDGEEYNTAYTPSTVPAHASKITYTQLKGLAIADITGVSIAYVDEADLQDAGAKTHVNTTGYRMVPVVTAESNLRTNHNVNVMNTGRWKITKRPIKATAIDKTITFGDPTPSFAANETYITLEANGTNRGLINVPGAGPDPDPDWVAEKALIYNALTVGLNGTYTDVNIDGYENAIVVALKSGSTAAEVAALEAVSDYEIEPVAGDYYILGAAYTIVAKPKTITYGEEYALTDFEYFTNGSDVADGQTVTFELWKNGKKLTELPKDAGTYDIKIVQNDAYLPTGYTLPITYVDETFTIAKKEVTAVLADQLLMVDDTKAALLTSKVKFVEDPGAATPVSGLAYDDDEIFFELDFNTTAAPGNLTADTHIRLQTTADAYNKGLTGALVWTGWTVGDAIGADAEAYNAAIHPTTAVTAETHVTNAMVDAAKAYNETLDGAQHASLLAAAVAGGPFNAGVKITVPATKDGYANKNYDVTYNVYGKLTVLDNNTLVLNSDDADLANIEKIVALGAAVPVRIDLNKRTQTPRQTPAPATAPATRKWDAQKWNTLVLPFDIEVAELSYKFGYAVVNVLDPANTTGTKVAFKLEMGTIPANTPFTIKTAKKLIKETADTDPNVYVDEDGIIIFDGTKTIKAPTADQKAGADAGNGCLFVPVYATKTVNSSEKDAVRFLMGNSDKWGRVATDGVEWDVVPFAAYIDLTGAGANARDMEFSFQEADGSTTTIKAIDVDFVESSSKSFNNGWYTLNGVKLQAAPTEKGVYINNGKKVVIK